ncbi:MAG: 1-acyl-sn-glycerol-3-phosphate acyltransferase [Planctomycetes bacterium]|nr:1-acyl-sn-glycerol-3-phosphate acyltransferase [Planctomycetota bacterium]
MKMLRGQFRLLRAGLVTLALYSTWLAGHAVLFASPAARARWRRAVMRRWCAALCRAFAIRVTVVGEPPSAGALVVSNHLSYLDIPVLGSCLSTAFVSKAEIARWPVIGALARQFDTVFLVRERKRELPAVNDAIAGAIERGLGVVLFPEGTSTRGAEVLAFRPSLLAPAAERGLAVRVASISYNTAAGDPPASLKVCWWGDMEFVPHVREMVLLDGIEARVEFAPEPVCDTDRKRLAEKLQALVKSRFRPVP